MSALPGIGSVVLYNYDTGNPDNAVVPLPAFVAATPDTWGAHWSDLPSYSEPPAGQVLLIYFLPGGVSAVLAAEGTGAGNFSTISKTVQDVVVPDA